MTEAVVVGQKWGVETHAVDRRIVCGGLLRFFYCFQNLTHVLMN